MPGRVTSIQTNDQIEHAREQLQEEAAPAFRPKCMDCYRCAPDYEEPAKEDHRSECYQPGGGNAHPAEQDQNNSKRKE